MTATSLRLDDGVRRHSNDHRYCGVTCAGDGVNGCTATTCTGACPGQMMCNGTLLDGSMNAVGSACN
jgi:hypothetical protein